MGTLKKKAVTEAMTTTMMRVAFDLWISWSDLIIM